MEGEVLSAEALEARYGFILRQAIPVDRHGDVPRIAVFQELNPDAPATILCSAVVQDGALVLVKSKGPVPVWVREGTNRWVNRGTWRAVDLDRTPKNLRHAEDMTGRWDSSNHGPLWGILHLEKVDLA
ncbi:MAG TPA: hypothetical protein VHJ82_08120 [Actinomycetota bacterium]|nr:hypothetical protein [Actinomycetota bacterium]